MLIREQPTFGLRETEHGTLHTPQCLICIKIVPRQKLNCLIKLILQTLITVTPELVLLLNVIANCM